MQILENRFYIKASLAEIVKNPFHAFYPVLFGIRQIFCDHPESFAYRKYDDFDFVEYCRCQKCGKVLKSFRGFDEDMRG